MRHRYEFSRNRQKFHLIERNRLILLLTLFERRTLLLLCPPLLALELAMLVSAARTGWVSDKATGWRWLIHHRRWIRARRRQLQAERIVSDADLAPLLARRIAPGNFDLPNWLRPLDRLLSLYWAGVIPLLAQSRGKPVAGHDVLSRATGGHGAPGLCPSPSADSPS